MNDKHYRQLLEIHTLTIVKVIEKDLEKMLFPIYLLIGLLIGLLCCLSIFIFLGL